MRSSTDPATTGAVVVVTTVVVSAGIAFVAITGVSVSDCESGKGWGAGWSIAVSISVIGGIGAAVLAEGAEEDDEQAASAMTETESVVRRLRVVFDAGMTAIL